MSPNELENQIIDSEVIEWIKTWDNLDDYDDSEQIIHDTSDGKQLVTFMLGNEKYCVNILSVHEIINDIRITPLPNMPDYIKGILNLRGAVIPVIDMRVKFRLSHDRIDKYTVIMTMKMHKRKIGIIVDTVSDVVYAPDHEIVPSTRNLNIIDTEFIEGVINIDGEAIMLLDIEMMFSKEQLNHFVHEDSNQSADEIRSVDKLDMDISAP